MPVIPEFTDTATVPIQRDTARADPGALAAPGLAAQAAGRQLERTSTLVGDEIAKFREFRNTEYYNDQYADATVTAHDRLEAAKEEARQTGNFEGFAAKQRAALDADLEPRIQGATSSLVGSRLSRRFASLTDTISAHAKAFENGMAIDSAKAGTLTDIDNAAKLALRDPTLADEQYARLKGRITGAGPDSEAGRGTNLLSEQQKRALLQQAGNAIYGAAVRTRAETDPAGLARDFKAGHYDPYIDYAHLESLNPLIEGAQARAIGREEFQNQMRGGGGGAAPHAYSEGHEPGGAPAGGGGGLDTGFKSKIDRMLADGQTAGFDLAVGSGRRTTAHQAELYQADLDAHGGKPSGMVAPPGHSMHEQGKAVDLVDRATGKTISGPAAQWVANNAANYDITVPMRGQAGRPNEPWHVEPVGARRGGGGGGPGAPDLDAGIANIERRAATGEFSADQSDKAIAEYSRNYHQWHQATQQQRTALVEDTKNSIARLAGGQETTIDPVALRRLLPGVQADDLIRAADEARETGSARNDVWLASPDALDKLEARMQARLDSGQDYARVARYKDQVEKQITARNDALRKDSAAFVRANSPDVEAAWSKVDPQTGAGAEAAVGASLAEQERLGVPEPDRRALTKEQAAEQVRAITTTDPSKQDMGAVLQHSEAAYGRYWHQVWGDLVRADLPPEAQLLGAMDLPEQAVARVDYQKMLSYVAEKGGVKRLAEERPAESAQIKGSIDGTLANFRGTINDQHLYDLVKDGVQHLAEYYTVVRDMDASAALQAAYDRIVDRKYDFSGTMRVPKGTLPTVEQAGDAMLQRVTGGVPEFDTNKAPGMVAPGNLDPWNRPVLKNPDGSYSTTSSISIGTAKGEVLIPTVVEGRRLSDEQAKARFRATGENLGIFTTPAAANDYATRLHNAQAAMRDAEGKIKLDLPADPPGNPLLTPAQRQANYLSGLQRGNWRTNENETGLYRTVKQIDGSEIEARRANGTRIEFKFDDAPALATARGRGVPTATEQSTLQP